MRRYIFISIACLALAAVILVVARSQTPRGGNPSMSPVPTLRILSSAFEENQRIPKLYSCDGANISPPLTISGVPVAAKSLTLIVDDPDAPMGTFVHWVVYGIKPTTTEIPDNTIPEGGQQGLNSAGQTNFVGPCPPSGTHHYRFTLYALDTYLTFSSTPDRTTFDAAMRGHTLEQVTLTGLYTRI